MKASIVLLPQFPLSNKTASQHSALLYILIDQGIPIFVKVFDLISPQISIYVGFHANTFNFSAEFRYKKYKSFNHSTKIISFDQKIDNSQNDPNALKHELNHCKDLPNCELYLQNISQLTVCIHTC